MLFRSVAQPAPIDEAELEVEAAQKSGLIARSRFTLGGLIWTGLGGLISLGLGLWATNLIEVLFATAESLGIIGVVFGLVFLVGLIGLAAREILAVDRVGFRRCDATLLVDGRHLVEQRHRLVGEPYARIGQLLLGRTKARADRKSVV